MNPVLIFAAGLVVGAIVGVLVYRNNAKKIERMANEQYDKIRREMLDLRRELMNRVK